VEGKNRGWQRDRLRRKRFVGSDLSVEDRNADGLRPFLAASQAKSFTTAAVRRLNAPTAGGASRRSMPRIRPRRAERTDRHDDAKPGARTSHLLDHIARLSRGRWPYGSAGALVACADLRGGANAAGLQLILVGRIAHFRFGFVGATSSATPISWAAFSRIA
jgi:hypothetical protein